MSRPLALIALVVTALLVGCGAASTAGTSAGCSKDTDCKGERICVAKRCVDPATPRPSPTTALTTPPVTAPQPAASAAPPPSPAAAPATPPAPTATSTPQNPPTGNLPDGTRVSPCGCKRDDLMCHMKCSQRDNAAAPATGAEPHDPCTDCKQGDLMCNMRCGAD